jgi:hypothetical protein
MLNRQSDKNLTKNNPLIDSVFSLGSRDNNGGLPPVTNKFLLLEGTDFMLLDGTNLCLLGT